LLAGLFPPFCSAAPAADNRPAGFFF